MSRSSPSGRPAKVCLVCSAGGHFSELASLQESWRGLETCWVTFDGPNTRAVLEGERVYHAYSPTIRNIPNLMRNLVLAWKVVSAERPSVIVSTGAAVCVPFFLVGRLRRVPTVFIESLTRITDLSMTGRLVYPMASVFLVQWPSLAERYRRAEFEGQVL